MQQQMPERIPGGGIDLSHLVAKAQATPASAAGAEATAQVIDVPAAVFDVSDHTFEPVTQLSQMVPVVVSLYSPQSEASVKLGPILAKVTREMAGRVVLGMVDVDANPGLAQAFQVQSLPTVVALINGQPVPLFQGVVPEDQLRELFGRIVELGQQQGLTARVNAPDLGEGDEDDASAAAPAEPEVPAAHREAVDAIDRGDYVGAAAAYEAVIAKAPRDEEARAALVQVRLLLRLDGVDANTVRAAASAAPADVDAQMVVADLDVSGGHVEDGFLRLLECYPAAETEDQARLRERLVELFEVVGVTEPRVIAARRRLASLLY